MLGREQQGGVLGREQQGGVLGREQQGGVLGREQQGGVLEREVCWGGNSREVCWRGRCAGEGGVLGREQGGVLVFGGGETEQCIHVFCVCMNSHVQVQGEKEEEEGVREGVVLPEVASQAVSELEDEVRVLQSRCEEAERALADAR